MAAALTLGQDLFVLGAVWRWPFVVRVFLVSVPAESWGSRFLFFGGGGGTTAEEVLAERA